MIHSRKKDPIEIFNFIHQFKNEFPEIPIVLVPTSYNCTLDEDLFNAGASIIIHANHLLRASYPAMQRVAKKILIDGYSKEIEKEIMSINEILNLIRI